ncbi:MAG: T9SS type A sorting domain-containing protein [Candidatus Delongbacteria bacterium]|nr:T9SS type A sorting domain-containing protein [Candidatus Delongbacteria bacterium]
MRLRSMSVLLVLAFASTALATLDDYYYTNDEIRHELDSLAAAHPNVMRVDSIGYTWETNSPIWSVKLSQNVSQELDKPALWVNGQCHAEEILGINISMAFIRELAHWGDLGHPNYAPLLQALEIHVVPTNNPDGLDVVMSEQDVTYRKNLHWFSPDGDCTIISGVGNDSCGVDLNRNYPAWFEHGDPLWAQNSDVEQYDYYRGPWPLSEPECEAVALQAERERFVAAVSYHSARTSTNHEIVIHPWEWEEGVKRCPPRDYTMMDNLTRGMADQIAGQEFEFYRNVAGSGRKGNHHNWIYREYGAVGMLIEVGLQEDAGMQPQNQETIDFIVDENLDGLYWLCRRIIGYQQDAPGLRLHTREAGSNTPLESRVRIEEVMHPDQVPFYRTDPTWGAYYRLLQPASYTLNVRKHGYQPVTQTINIAPTAPTSVNLSMTPLPRHTLDLSFESSSGQSLLLDVLELQDLDNDTTLTFHNQSDWSLELPEGNWRMVARNVYHVSNVSEFSLDSDMSLSPVLFPTGSQGAQIDAWLSQIEDFSQEGTGCGWVPVMLDEYPTFKDSADEFSPDDMDCLLLSTQQFELMAPVSRTQTAGVFEFDAWYALEGARDSSFVEIHPDGGDPVRVMAFTGRATDWRHVTVDLGPWAGQLIRVGFRTRTDGSITDAGLLLRNVHLAWNGDAVAVEPEDGQPIAFALDVYPNPFNPSTTVSIQLPQVAAGATLVAGLYDLRGALVARVANLQGLSGSTFETHIDGTGLASGVYLLQVHVEKGGAVLFSENRRVTLVK